MAEWSFHFAGKAKDVTDSLKKAKGGPAYTKALTVARAFIASVDPAHTVSVSGGDSDLPGAGFNLKCVISDAPKEPAKK
jgi:hypothetical protein